MATPPLISPAAKTAAAILHQIDQISREHGHGQVIVHVRDGKVVLIETRRTFLPENAPE